ncbi:flagellin [Planococcus sp. SIMBA_160]
MIINHNIAALNTHRQMGSAQSAQMDSMEKLSSGLRINSAKDDEAGLTISEKMRGQIRGLEQASTNAQDGISLIQTAEGSLSVTQDILQRMRELSVQASNDTNTGTDRNEIQKEISQLVEEIDRIGNATEFNTKKLLNGGANVAGTVDTSITGLSVVGGTGDTKVGASVTITGISEATAATTTGGTNATTGTALNQASTVTVNGTSFSFKDAETTENVLKAINDAGIGVTASLVSNELVLTSGTVGSSSKLEISAATGNFAGMATDSGTDATITSASNYSAQGNTITIEGGEAKGLQLEVGTGASVNTTGNITVDSNGSLKFQIGANENQEINLSITDMRASALGVSGVDVTSQTGAKTAITTINKAIEEVSGERSKLGATQNRLEHTINNLNVSSENLTSAESRIRDVDYAEAA